MKTLTLQTLKDKLVCAEAHAKFKLLFGESVIVTVELCEKHAKDFDWQWAAENLLSTPARAEYDKVRDPTWAEFDKVCEVVRAGYEKVCEDARAEFDKVCDPAWAEYRKMCARAFANAFNSDK
jgi:hypothetical protein